MAQTQTAKAKSVKDKLRDYVRAREELEHLERRDQLRWSASAMRKEAIRHFPEADLRALRARLDAAPDKGRLPDFITFVKQTLGQSEWTGYLAPSRTGVLLKYRPGLEDPVLASVGRFHTSLAELYGLAVLELADSQPSVFGQCDDPPP